MEALKSELNELDDEKLSSVNQLKKKHLIKLAETCARVRITDSMNLKQIFDMFKQPEIKF